MNQQELQSSHFSPSPFPDQRWAPRSATQLLAHLVHDSSSDPIPCIVRDMSSTGMCVEMGRQLVSRLPGLVTITIPRDRARFRCAVIWNGNGRAGLKFIAHVQHLDAPVYRKRSIRTPDPKSLAKRLFGARN